MIELSLLLAAAKPAGGAALDQVAIATGGATIVTALLLWLCVGHRSGKVPWLGRAADRMADATKFPGWAALPLAVAAVALLTALLGMYWDIALHIGVGRDEGPLANPAHYLILIGLYGVFAAGILAVALPRKGERPGPAAVRIAEGWHAPIGGILMAVCGGFALIGFPLDDMWHRLFGQDVTLWGPTHLMLIGGAGMTTVGQAVLLTEALRARKVAGGDQMPSKLVAFRRIGLIGGFLIGLSTFQAEFDFGVPQFAQVLQPMLIALAAGVALVAGRLWYGAGGALLGALFFLVVRGIVDVVTGPAVFDEPFPTLPLYLAEAVVVELAALALLRGRSGGRPVPFGVLAGVLIGTVGFTAEYAWTQVAFRNPWTADLLPEGVVFAIAGGVAGGLVGALLGLGLRGELPRPAVARTSLAVAGALVAIFTVMGLSTSVPSGVRAQIELRDVTGGAADREGQATVRITPASAAEGTKWLTVTAWQGGGLHVDRLKRVSEGVYSTTEPMPLHPDWKTLVRLHEGDSLSSAPVYLPKDPAIPAPEIPAATRIDRPFVAEVDLLQRERKDAAGWLWATAAAVVLALYVAFLAALAWGVGRLSRRWDGDDGGAPATAAEPKSRFERAQGPGHPVASGLT